MQTTPTQDDFEFQNASLQAVSRTFALTIPQLPETLCSVVGNGYLLCRIADTIEDDAELPADQKRHFSERFIEVVEGTAPAASFAQDLHPLLSDQTLPAERELIAKTDTVIRITHSYNAAQQAALARCVRIMAKGMADYQDQETLHGLPDQPAMDDYCYYVAGVVGEMLTALFCDYSDDIAANQAELDSLAVSFGQGLQMTNILKDIWDDHSRGACWLPQHTFSQHGFDLAQLSKENHGADFQDGLGDLLGIARHHLDNALSYTLLIPAEHKGIRKFCLWAIGMAVLTLRKLNKNRDFTDGREVKISRRSVKATILFSNLLVSSDKSLKLLFKLLSSGLPSVPDHARISQEGRQKQAINNNVK